MAGRFPFDSSGHSSSNPLNNPQVRAALGLSNVEEAVLYQRQQEMQRDFQLRQMLLQEQFDQYSQQNRLENILAQEQQIKAIGDHLQEYPDLQQHYSRLLLTEQLQRTDERSLANDRLRLQAEEELRRRQLLQAHQHQQLQQHQQEQQKKLQLEQQKKQQEQQQQQQTSQLPAHIQSAVSVVPRVKRVNQSLLRDIAADSLAGNAVKRNDYDKRQFAVPEAKREETPVLDAGGVAVKKRTRSSVKDGADFQTFGKKPSKGKKAKKDENDSVNASDSVVDQLSNNERRKSSFQDLLDFASSTEPVTNVDESVALKSPQSVLPSPRGSFGDLIEAARTETQNDDAADILTSLKKDKTEWSESEDEETDEVEERQIATAKGDTIMLPNFESYLPQLPEEPMLLPPEEKKKKKKKHKGILDEDDSSVETKLTGKKKDGKAAKAAKDGEKKAFERAFGDLPYPIDPWWPTTTSIKRERKALGQSNHEEDCCTKLGDEEQFHANVDKIKDRLKHNVEPGVLEKIPHCRVHRMAMKKRKNTSAPELVYCTQVTELYPNDIMVCCSRCGTWRHTACGGHYKQYSVREAIEKPFEAICDRCHVEEKILDEHPIAQKRIDRQRCEQLRRGLSTSAAMRQHSFSKHGGTYKWPLGSVSATHIGGHTRSVHSRHDKAEKQWTDMATKLGRGYGQRPKEKVKVRTKELERLLISIEDAEGHTDRHNMLVFLMQDTIKKAPVGFEKSRRNIFDPEDDDASESNQGSDCEEDTSLQNEKEKNGREIDVNAENSVSKRVDSSTDRALCKRVGCTKLSRFDSIFCSDACGVSTLESDLLRTFFYSSDIHPSSLRH